MVPAENNLAELTLLIVAPSMGNSEVFASETVFDDVEKNSGFL